jgi:hypothetical protein
MAIMAGRPLVCFFWHYRMKQARLWVADAVCGAEP